MKKHHKKHKKHKKSHKGSRHRKPSISVRLRRARAKVKRLTKLSHRKHRR